MTDQWLTLREAATLSGLSTSHLRLLTRTGKLSGKKIGRDWFTTEAAIRSYLADDRLRSRDPRKKKRGKVEP